MGRQAGAQEASEEHGMSEDWPDPEAARPSWSPRGQAPAGRAASHRQAPRRPPSPPRQPPPRGPRPRRSWRSRWRGLSGLAKFGYISAVVLTAGAVLVSLTGYALYLKLNHNITVTNVGGLTHRSDFGVQNIIILGSQTRNGQGPGFGYDPNTNLSDNLLLVHLNATHTHAIVVSIPRDTMVYEPACKSRFGNYTVPAQPQAIIDGAMNLGGPTCAVATVEHLTQIPLDHFIEFDFNSFRTMVDTLGGVEVCLPQAVNDPYSNLHLSAGRHLISGNQALAFVRTRHGVGDGTDLGRIELQQEFFSSLIQKVESDNTLENPLKLYDIADTATKSVTVDPGLGSVSKLLSLASTLHNLHTKDVTFLTMPTIEDPANNNRLLPEEPEDDMIWQMLLGDTPWPGHLPVTPAGGVGVTVLNGTGITGLAARTAASLRSLGFDVTRVGNAPYSTATTVTYPGPAQAGGAYSLMGALQQAPDNVQDGASGPVTLTLGTDFTGVVPPQPTTVAKHHKHQTAPASTAPDAGQQPDGTQLQIPGQAATTVESRNAAEGICQGVPDANPDTGSP
jgi:LCP family protein required for cell wall assembly